MITNKNLYSWAVSLLVLPCIVASAQVGHDSAKAPSPQELFKQLSSSVFVVESLDANGNAIALGSGVGIAPNQVVTNRHVVEGGTTWRVRLGESTWSATIAFLDAEHDLCGLSVTGLKGTPVSFRLSSTLSVGEHVYTLGAPEGLELSLAEGLVSALRKFEGVSFIQTTAAISHGSSGGGLFDGRGNLIGITTFTFKDGQNLNFAIPTDLVIGLKDHPATELHQTDVERNGSQAMMLSQVASNAMESGDFQKALGAYKQLSILTPNDPVVWFSMGNVYLQLEQPDNAMQACEKALRLDSSQADSWGCMGEAHLRLRQLHQAKEAFKRAIDLHPSEEVQITYQIGLGMVYGAEGNEVGVMGVYERLKTLDHNYADRFYKRVVEPMFDSPH